jgi:hypothetical protein
MNIEFMLPVPFNCLLLSRSFVQEFFGHSLSILYFHTVSNATVSELFGRGFDDELRAVVARNLESRGINLHPRTNLTEVIFFLLGLLGSTLVQKYLASVCVYFTFNLVLIISFVISVD